MKMRVTLWAVVFALAFAARAERLVIDAPPVVALVDEDGAEIVEGGAYEALFEVRAGELYAAGRRGEYRLLNGDGGEVSRTRFAMIEDAGDALIYRVAESYGAMDAAGRILLRPEWTQLVPAGEGGWLALDGDPLDDRPDEIVYIDADGAERRTGVTTASGLAALSEERMPYMASGGRFGAVDSRGEVAVKALWRSVGAFSSGVAVVAGESGMGLIDREGGVVVEPVYRWMARFGERVAALGDDGLDVYAADGTAQLWRLPGALDEVTIVGGAIGLTDAEGAALYDADGALIARGPRNMTFAPGLSGRYIVNDGAWGEACQWLMNPDGSAASGRFQRLLPLCGDRYAYMTMTGRVYISDDLDGRQTSWDYDSVRFGLMNGAGETLTDAVYTEIRPLGDHRLLLITPDEVAMADLDGKILKAWEK